MSGHRINLKGYRLTKAGKLERIPGYGMDVSAKLRQRGSKRVRVGKRPRGMVPSMG